MSAARFAELRRIGARTVSTAQAAAAWGVSVSSASRTLADMAETGLIEAFRHGLWLMDTSATPESLAQEVTAPYPSYVSHVSALYAHGIIDQIPSDVHLAVAGASPRRIETSRGTYSLHSLPAALFGGYAEIDGTRLATPEKALFDWAYLSTASGAPNARLPETSGWRQYPIAG
jgi:predicted transcriptional regulator of viral defense system